MHRRRHHPAADLEPHHKLAIHWQKLVFIFMGIASTLWFLMRVIPKPSRATYPCMKAAAPLASTFVIYLLGLSSSIFAFRKARVHFAKTRYLFAGLCMAGAVIALTLTLSADHQETFALGQITVQTPNQPVGVAKGIYPGRVVWVHDPDATNEKANPTAFGHGWFLSEHNNQAVIDKMVSTSLRAISGQHSDAAAWEAVFKFHNKKRGKGEVNYKIGEKIMIKTNATSSWGGNYSTSNLAAAYNNSYGISETSPHLVLAVLRQLVQIAGVAQTDIYVGDPMKHIYKHCYDLWHAEFPDIHYLDHDGFTQLGRVKAEVNASASLFYSDRGAVLGVSSKSDKIYKIFDQAEYLINLPTMKAHSHAGITMFAKNHFGSHTRGDANHLHAGLVATVNRGVVTRPGYNLYRIQVDLMGHKVLGGKNLFYLMDALWSADFEIGAPVKFKMAPFNDDWTSSLFISLDPVAIESVGYDFLHSEFTVSRGLNPYPQMEGTDDYLHQAASSANWPAGVTYDPENDGTPITSLGVHEHWNDSVNKQYTRNLGTGTGIELYQVANGTGVAQKEEQAVSDFRLYANYPNPFNAATTIRYQLAQPAQAQLGIFSITGQIIRSIRMETQSPGVHQVVWDGCDDRGIAVPSGTYVYQLRVSGKNQAEILSKRMLLVR